MMKKTALILLSVLVLLFSGCTTASQTERGSPLETESDTPVQSIDDLFAYSTNVVRARLLTVKPFDQSVSVYSFEVQQDFTENTPSEIHVYAVTDYSFKSDRSYYLFMQGHDNALYPHTIYHIVGSGFAPNAADPQITIYADGVAVPWKTKNPEESIKTAVSDKKTATKEQILSPKLSESTDLSVLFKEADLVVRVRLSDPRPFNVYAAGYAVEVLTVLKGDENGVASHINLPPDLDLSKTYYLFLQKDPQFPQGYNLFSRVYPVVEVTDETEKLFR